jgi:hypothetical protein
MLTHIFITDYCTAEFDTSDYGQDMGADIDGDDPPTCQYRGYRNSPHHEKKYDLSPQYWHVFTARLAFVVVFEVMSRTSSASNAHTIQIFSINPFRVSPSRLHIKNLKCQCSCIFKFQSKTISKIPM